MPLTIFWIIILILYFDIKVLKQLDASIFQEKFTFPPTQRILFIILSSLLVLLSLLKGRGIIFLFFCILFIFPVYLLRRFRMVQALEKIRDNIASQTRQGDLFLALDAFTVLIIWLMGSLLIVFFIQGMMKSLPNLNSELGELILTSLFSSTWMVILIYFSVRKYVQPTFLTIIGLKKGDRSWWKVTFVPTVLGIFCAYWSSLILMTRHVQPSTPLSQIIEGTNSSILLVMFLGIAILIAPLLEEIIFRGYFFYVLKRFKGQTFAIIFIASIFAILHFDQYWGDQTAIFIVTVLGFTLTLLRAWTGTTIASVITHYVYNTGVTIIPIIMIMFVNPPYFEYYISYNQLAHEQKEKLLLESIERQTDLVEAYNDLAWLYTEDGKNLEKALHLIDKALLYDPQRYTFLDTKAEVLYKLGRLDEAIEIERQLVKKNPRNEYLKNQLKKFADGFVESDHKQLEKIDGGIKEIEMHLN